jgi:hypothetical protein
MQRFQNTLQSVIGGRDGNQMDMVGHEATGEYFNTEFLAVFLEPRQIRLTIHIREKDVFPPVATLGDVVRHTGKYGPG